MSVYKKLNKQDVIVTPYVVNKTWVITTGSDAPRLLDSYYNRDAYFGTHLIDIGVSIFEAQNITGSFEPITSPQSNNEYKQLLYNSLKQLYFSNFQASPLFESGSFDNFNQSTLKTIKPFPTESNVKIGCMSISQEFFGNCIKPNSFVLTSSKNDLIKDDGEGNLIDVNVAPIYNNVVGNIIYSHGLLVFSSGSYRKIYSNILSSGSFSMTYQSEHIIYETQYVCTINDNEMNYSHNPSLKTDNSGSLIGYANSPYFNTYITTIGLYNEANELLMVGKLAQPIPISRNTDTNFKFRKFQ